MTPLLNKNLEPLHALCTKNNVAQLFLFGSALSTDFQDNSDLDFAVIFKNDLSPLEQGISFFELKTGLENLFNREIDLISYRVIKNPIFKEELDNTMVELYAA